MRLKRRHITPLLLLLNYTLAITVGAWFHTHHEQDLSCGGSCGCALHKEHSADSLELGHVDHQHVGHHHHVACDLPSPAKKKLPHSKHDERTCAVCKFLAQKPVFSPGIIAVSSTPLVREVATPLAACRAVRLPRAFFTRGPPSNV